MVLINVVCVLQADFEIQREIFEQKLYDLKQQEDTAASKTNKKPRKEVPFKHTLKFEYINPDEVCDVTE